MSNENTNQSHQYHDPHDHAVGHGEPPYVILFVFVSIAMGALIRSLLNKVPVNIPYTVLLLIVGVLIGLLSSNFHQVAKYTIMVHMDPHLILHVFLPVLIFESAFAMDVHTFLKSAVQVCILALFGLMVASLLTAVLAQNVFDYGWDFNTAMMFGSIMSATDPVAVVALLKDLGASKQLGTLIEGESLLNDGCSIVIFEVFKRMSIPGQEMTGTAILIYFVRVAFGGPIFGYIMARLTTLWLSYIFNDALTEITITLASTYITFYIGEGVLKVSGVLAVVVLGLVVSVEKTSISPEVEVFLHRFWEMLAYLANTLIFVLVGVVIVERAMRNVNDMDWFYIIVLYIGVNIIRAIAIALFSPILSRIGYGLSWRNAAVMTWGGLRGAVGLALALLVVSTEEIDQKKVGSKVLLHTSGIVILTLCVNATTIQSLLRVLGMSDISIPKRIAMAGAVRRLRESQSRTFAMLKADRFLADADWEMAETACEIEDPYRTTGEEHVETSELGPEIHTSTCPTCHTEVRNEPSAKEYADMASEARLRMLKAEKVSYWKQFEHGMLSREAVRLLGGLTETVGDEEDRFIGVDDIQKYWEVRGIWPYMKMKLEDWIKDKKDTVPAPKPRWQQMVFNVVRKPGFDYFIYTVIGLNLIPIGLEFGYHDPEFETPQRILNFVFCFIYIVEATLKLIGLRKHYFFSYWNIFDFLIMLLSIVDLIVEFTMGDTAKFNPNILKVIRVFKVLRAFRGLRLVKVIIPRIIGWVNSRINAKLSLGYDVGKGFVVGEEEVSKLIEHMVDNEKILKTLKSQSEVSRLAVIRELGLLQRTHPGIAISVKTRQSIRTVLNHTRDTLHELQGGGILDEQEAQKLEQMIEIKMKHLMNAPASIAPPSPEFLLCNIAWLQGDEHTINFITTKAEMLHFDYGDIVVQQGELPNGIYLIVSGMVKFHGSGGHHHDGELIGYGTTDGNSTMGTDIFEDYLGAGNVIGEMGLLTRKPRNATVSCETSVQAFFISAEDMYAAIATNTEPPSLEYRLWRVCAIRVATPLLMNQITHQNWTQEKVKLHLEKAYLPDVADYNYAFNIDDTMDDVVLVHGLAYNAHTREKIHAPSVIHRNVHKLIFPSDQEIEPRLLVVPTKEYMTSNLDAPISTLSAHLSKPNVVAISSKLCLHHATEAKKYNEEVIAITHGKSPVHDVIFRPTGTNPPNNMEYSMDPFVDDVRQGGMHLTPLTSCPSSKTAKYDDPHVPDIAEDVV
ncbi:sperm-specific sodium:proton exchanger-like [Glandiceps talaboti]